MNLPDSDCDDNCSVSRAFVEPSDQANADFDFSGVAAVECGRGSCSEPFYLRRLVKGRSLTDYRLVPLHLCPPHSYPLAAPFDVYPRSHQLDIVMKREPVFCIPSNCFLQCLARSPPPGRGATIISNNVGQAWPLASRTSMSIKVL